MLLDVLKETRTRRLTRLVADEPSATVAIWEHLTQVAPKTKRPWVRELAQASTRPEPRSPGAGPASSLLSSREIQILGLVASGQSNKQVARSLFLTENTIESHLRRINGKLGTRTRTQALAKAREIGTI